MSQELEFTVNKMDVMKRCAIIESTLEQLSLQELKDVDTCHHLTDLYNRSVESGAGLIEFMNCLHHHKQKENA